MHRSGQIPWYSDLIWTDCSVSASKPSPIVMVILSEKVLYPFFYSCSRNTDIDQFRQSWTTPYVLVCEFNPPRSNEHNNGVNSILCLRLFSISKEATGEVREVRQFHFTSWPDMSVPQCPILLNFMKVVNAYEPDDAAPPVVHCR